MRTFQDARCWSLRGQNHQVPGIRLETLHLEAIDRDVRGSIIGRRWGVLTRECLMSNLRRTFKLAAAVAGGVVCMSISDNVSSLRQANVVTTADARVGRPLTPVSVAGVARRTTRRAVVRHGAYYGAAYYGTRGYYGNGYYRRY